MGEWRTIDSAPKDGTVVIAVAENKAARRWSTLGRFPYPLKSKFIDDQWCCDMGDRWAPYDPQPTHWIPVNTYSVFGLARLASHRPKIVDIQP